MHAFSKVLLPGNKNDALYGRHLHHFHERMGFPRILDIEHWIPSGMGVLGGWHLVWLLHHPVLQLFADHGTFPHFLLRALTSSPFDCMS